MSKFDQSTAVFCAGVLLVVLGSASACFITNCPPGGKRSGRDSSVKQCEPCGPAGASGRCFGPSICCSPKFGCWFGTPESMSCQLENRFTTLCQSGGSSCSGASGDLNNGRCAAENVCCNSETCSADSNCREEAVHHAAVSAPAVLDSLYQRLSHARPSADY